MTGIELPQAIRTFVDATNAGDSERFVSAFTADAHLNDWGRDFHGHEGIRDWDRTDNIGKRSHFEVVGATAGEGDDIYVITLAVSGGGFNGTGPMRFTLGDGLIADVLIS
jgi:hypothetical protein